MIRKGMAMGVGGKTSDSMAAAFEYQEFILREFVIACRNYPNEDGALIVTVDDLLEHGDDDILNELTAVIQDPDRLEEDEKKSSVEQPPSESSATVHSTGTVRNVGMTSSTE